jgi:hypothetical protein
MFKFKHFKSFLPLLVLLMFSACAEVIPVEECIPGDSYGFLGGLWHGIISPVSFVISIFLNDVAIYAVNNNGGWYDFGFVLGAGILFGGGGKASK